MRKQQTKIEASAEQMSVLLNIAKEIGSVHNFDQLMDLLAKESARAMKADRCSIFLLDVDKKELWSKVAIGEEDSIRFPMDHGIAGETIGSGKSLIINDAYNHPKFNPEIDKQTGYESKTIMTAPMRNADAKVIGCFEVINKYEGDFLEEDASFLQLLANHAAAAVESALLHRQNEKMIQDLKSTHGDLALRMKQLEFMYDIDKILAETIGFQVILEKIGLKICEFFQAEYFSAVYRGDKGLPVSYVFNAADQKIEKHIVKMEEGSDLLPNSLQEIEVQSGIKLKSSEAAEFKHEAKTEDEELIRVEGFFKIINLAQKFDRTNRALLDGVAEKIASAALRAKLLEKRERSQRLETIGQLSSTIIHDIRSPMTTIRGFAEILAGNDESLGKEKREKLCGIIVSQVDRCSNMIEELLSFARGEKNFNLKPFGMDNFMEDILDVLKMETEKKDIILESDIAYKGPFVVDKEKLMRVVFNLSNNAIEFLKAGEKLVLETSIDDQDMVSIIVKDTGPGVPIELQDTLFEAFVTHGKKKGTGLGLHISKEIVEGHGGKIELDKTYKDGAKFVIKLPAKGVPEQS